jgi:protein TonB
MPSDFLRDVLRTNDAARPAPRRWPLFPLSLVVHAVGAMAYFVIPLAADVTPPTPRPLHADRRVLIRVLPPQPRVTATAAPPQGPLVRPTGHPPTTATPPPSVPFTLPGLPVGGSTDTAVGFSVDKPSVPASLGSGSPSPEKSDLGAAPAVETKPVRVGGNIRAPQRLSATAPIYPPIAQSARVQGQVVVEALIDVNGRVGEARILKSVPLLDAAAVDAVRTWRYAPTLLNGVPVSVLLTVTVSFTLGR